MKAHTFIPVAVHFLSLLPLAILAFQFSTGQLEPNPAQALEQLTGRIALSFFTATLLISPLSRLLKQPVIQRTRRPLGLYTFFYVALHLSILVGFDYRFNLPLLSTTYLGKPFIWLGLATSLILAILALTSFDWWKHRLGKWWQWLHRLIYLAAILDLAHFFLAVKGNLLSLSGNLGCPLLFPFAIGLLLILRIFQRQDRPVPPV